MNDTEDESLFTKEHVKTILRHMAGAGILGLGAGGIYGLVHYLAGLEKDKREADDDTLYIYKDPNALNKSASDSVSAYDDFGTAAGELAGKGLTGTGNLLARLAKGVTEGAAEGLNQAANGVKDLVADPAAAGVATALSVLTALGGFSLARKAYAKYEKEKVQKDLDNAQLALFNAEGYKKAAAEAGEEFSPTGVDYLAGGVTVGLPLLLLVASGVATNQYLKMQYPLKKKLPKPPRRIEVIDSPEDVAGADTYEKRAAATEFALHMIDAAGRADSDVRNVISAVARDGANEFKKAASAMGLISALNMVKGASHDTDPAARHVAISYLAHSPMLSPQIGVVAAGELAETYPTLFKAAASASDEVESSLYGVAATLGASIRRERACQLGIIPDDFDKEAAVSTKGGPSVDESLERWLNVNAQNRRPTTKGDSDESTGTSGEEAGISDPDSPSKPTSTKQVLLSGKTGRTHTDSTKLDVIDNFFQPTKKEAPGDKGEEPSDQQGGFKSPLF